MRSFQFALHRAWDRLNPEALVRWSPEIRQDLLWWLDRERLELVSPQLDLWSDASDVGWGAHLGVEVVSGLWSPEGQLSSINHRELLAIFYALHHFLPLVQNSAVAVYADNMTALASLRNQGSTRSAVLNRTAQDLLRWAERFHLPSASIQHGAQQRVGRFSLSSKSDSWFRVDPETVCVSAVSEKVAGVNRPVRNLTKSPLLTLFFSIPRSQCSGDRCSSPTVEWVAGVCLSSYALIPAILKKLRSSSGVLLTIIAPYWPQRPWFPKLDGPVALPLDRDLLSQPHVHRQHLGLSRLALHAWRLSSDL